MTTTLAQRLADNTLLAAIVLEANSADAKYGPFHSTHEGYGVLAEEVAELLEAIRSNKLESVRLEAIQVAAVALRIAEACRGDEAFRGRSGA